jgi:putative heme-binding domain-containing protein
MDNEVTLGLLSLGGKAPEKLIESWKDLSNVSRSVLLNHMVQRESNAALLLSKIQQGAIPPNDVDASTIQTLRNSPKEEISNLAISIFGPAPGADRPAIARQWLSQWPSKADPSVGQIAYQKHCAVCHEGRRQGDQYEESLAPNLKGLNHWTNEAWMVAILDPNRSVEEKYWVFQARTEDGELITGLKLQEDEQSLQWVSSTGRIELLDKKQIAQWKMSERSLMPEGFEQLLTPQEIAGIISYLRTSSSTAGAATTASPSK